MALLLRKLSILPVVGRSIASRSLMAAYFSGTSAALRHNIASQSAVNNDNDDFESAVEDEFMNVDQEFVDDRNFVESVDCRVSTPTRRPWATMQDENALRFRFDMPGISKDAVKVYVDNSRLVVKGKYPPLEEQVDEDHVLADNVGMYAAEIELPENVKMKEIKSQMKDGMLLVTAPKEVVLIPVE